MARRGARGTKKRGSESRSATPSAPADAAERPAGAARAPVVVGPVVTRRRLALGGLALGGAAALGLVVHRLSTSLRQAHEERRPWRQGPFGPLVRDPHGILDLPEGFSYTIVDRAGDAMDDGYRVPARPDGMACFPGPDGTLVLMRNHENPRGMAWLGPVADGALPPEAFDPEGMGGVTRVVLDGGSLARRSSNLVLCGTAWNCAGGPSPWGWLSCEETTEAGHGWVFACPVEAERVVPARPIRGYGRFKHEAVAVDGETMVAYLSEDQMDSCLYRFVPREPARDPWQGQLFALAIPGRPGLDTGARLAAGERTPIAWVPIDDPTPDDDTVRTAAQAAGAAIFRRGEGLAATRGERGLELVITATVGGPAAAGQIFRLLPEGDGGELEVIAESRDTDELDMPDNVTVSPRGEVYFCEDGHGRNHVRGIDPRDGALFDFARNALSGSELAGVCFSPDGRAMFVSLQTDGLTLAIRGPFRAA